jgi:hypothetical protein
MDTQGKRAIRSDEAANLLVHGARASLRLENTEDLVIPAAESVRRTRTHACAQCPLRQVKMKLETHLNMNSSLSSILTCMPPYSGSSTWKGRG